MVTEPSATPSFIAPGTSGALGFQLTVTDNGGASHSDTITVTVNAPPVADAGADRTVSAGAAVSLMGMATDFDGEIASVTWSQTSGPAVTLSNANSTAATFTAPTSAAELSFSLLVTDNHGATDVDELNVHVTAIIDPQPITVPNITRQPNNPRSFVHGSGLFLVAATGGGLNYEWRRSSGTVVKSGPEPYLLRTSLGSFENDDCYYVVVSNDLGVDTSDLGCLTVDEIPYELDPFDEPQTQDDVVYAQAWGDALMTIVQQVTGPLTAPTGGTVRLGVPLQFGPPEDCYSGSYEGATLDGTLVATGGTPPLGHHVITEAWNDCLAGPDAVQARTAAIMVEYDFPQTFGVGTLTIHVSDRFFNGTVHATVVANGSPGDRSDDIDIVVADNFSAGLVKASSNQLISVDRRYSDDDMHIDQTYLSLINVFLTGFDADGSVGSIHAKQGGNLDLLENLNAGEGDPRFVSSSVVVVGIEDHVFGALEPQGAQSGWNFEELPLEECPGDYVCVDLP